MRDYKQFFAICKKHGFDYKEKVAEFTEGRTESLTALNDGEYKEMMVRLTRLNAPMRKGFTPKPGNPQRRKMIAIARDMRWDIRGNSVMMERLDNYCLTKTKYKKKLNELSEEELNKVLFIFEKEVKSSFLKGLNQ